MFTYTRNEFHIPDKFLRVERLDKPWKQVFSS